ncbi:MAG: hypothetical protein MI743_20990 [Sneathiellales bacterium]|nr:hypothetical protein [Sneathiellales bacterium]
MSEALDTHVPQGKGDLKNSKEEYEIKLLKYQVDSFWTIKAGQTLIAGLVLAGTLALLPEGYLSAQKRTISIQKEKIAQIESDLDLKQKKESNLEARVNELKLKLETLKKASISTKEELKKTILENKDLNEKIGTQSSENQIKELWKEIAKKEKELLTLQADNNAVKANLLSQLRSFETRLNKADAKVKSLSENIFSNAITISVSKEILSDGEFYEGSVYLDKKIDPRKLNNLAKVTGAETEKVRALIDLTLLGTAEEGFLFQDCNLYYSDNGNSGNLSYRDALKKMKADDQASTRLFIGEHIVDVISGDLSAAKIVNTVKDIHTRHQKLGLCQNA